MSAVHDEVFSEIRYEYEDVISALKQAQKGYRKGGRGSAVASSKNLTAAIATARDAYALLIIASAEALIRRYLESIGVNIGSEPRLSSLIDRSFKEFNRRVPASGIKIRKEDREAMHELRSARNEYAHGESRDVFPTVSKVQSTVSKFFSQIV